MNLTASNDNESLDVLRGGEAIAAFLGEDKRATFYAIKQNLIPHYRIGQQIRARKSTLLAWIAKQEQVAA